MWNLLASVVVLVIGGVFLARRADVRLVLALSAAALLSVQFWYADRGGAYVLWFLPLLLLLVFRPNLTDRAPPPPADDWLARLGRALAAVIWRVLRLRKRAPEKAATSE